MVELERYNHKPDQVKVRQQALTYGFKVNPKVDEPVFSDFIVRLQDAAHRVAMVNKFNSSASTKI